MTGGGVDLPDKYSLCLQLWIIDETRNSIVNGTTKKHVRSERPTVNEKSALISKTEGT